MLAAATGFITGLTLIMAIGAQNAFVLRQGLARVHVFAVCLTCAVSDALLILAGVGGAAAVTARLPWLVTALTLAGAAFLLVYGGLRFRAALADTGGLEPAARTRQSLWRSIATCLAVTWLNPHVYLDTLGLIGAVSTGFPPAERPAFALGAMTASLVFFFTLGYGARLLAPVMQHPRAWRMLDLGIGALMWVIAAGLIVGL